MNASRIASLLLSLIFCAAPSAADRQLPGRVARIVDGDSLILVVRGGRYRVELEEIDAPELNQPWGKTAADRLKRALTGRFVLVKRVRTLADGRIQGRVFLSSRDVGLDLLLDGLAWCKPAPVTEIPTQNRPYRDAEARARMLRRGLWSDEAPVPPWQWRYAAHGGHPAR